MCDGLIVFEYVFALVLSQYEKFAIYVTRIDAKMTMFLEWSTSVQHAIAYSKKSVHTPLRLHFITFYQSIFFQTSTPFEQ